MTKGGALVRFHAATGRKRFFDRHGSAYKILAGQECFDVAEALV